jgi:diamine N-acetyltransferase
VTAPAAPVTLRPVTAEIFPAVVKLRVADEQRGFVAENVYSLAQTTIYPWTRARAVLAGDQPVGFALFGLDPADGAWSIVRLMIDAGHQRRGYGREALRLVLADIERERRDEDVLISLVPANLAARRLYESVGFRDTGRLLEGEHVLRWEPPPRG